MAKRKTSASSRTPIAARVVPNRRALILLESGLLLGLAEGIMWNAITQLHVQVYLKGLLLMLGVIGLFAIAVRILEPIIQTSLKAVSKLDTGQGALMRIGLHAIILFLIYVAYVRTFFPTPQ